MLRLSTVSVAMMRYAKYSTLVKSVKISLNLAKDKSSSLLAARTRAASCNAPLKIVMAKSALRVGGNCQITSHSCAKKQLTNAATPSVASVQTVSVKENSCAFSRVVL